MNKTARIFFTLLLAVFLLSGCSRKQAPSKYGDATRTGNSDTGNFVGIIPDGNTDGSFDPEDWGNGAPGELQERGDINLASNKYGDFTMVEGVLPSIYFGFDSSSVPAAERAKLQSAAEYLQQNTGHHLLVEGHCDWYGTSEYNLALGDRRANSVSDYLGTLGITPLRIDKLSVGSLEATSGLSKSESGQDRRADLIILKK